ncbi:putative F-box protein At3g29830 [Hevea brasiliensis]|uniref:putative F-box protein At3g29830 n=1 Tax=Hevea brasiliensis TaxID=3981 RepID=UPI002600378D|nr:putative F-box protein At3g29830 [Hevea brasiliensis]
MKKPTASSSPPKRSFKTMNNNKQDLFSMLSSHLLVLIVSYLPFKEAARTSILSKQWRDIWRQNTKRLLARNPKKDIQKFSLACSKPEDFLIDIQNFVIFAISRNARELELDFSDPTRKEVDDLENHPAIVELPSQVYQHVGLESLKLFSCNFDASRIEGPKLRFLKLLSDVSHFHLSNQSNMLEVDIDFGKELNFEEVIGSLVHNFLLELYAVKVLTMCSVLF